MVSRFVRRVRTSSGAVAAQLVTRQGRQVLGIEHVGSAHTDEELALLLAAAKARLMPGQYALEVGAVQVVAGADGRCRRLDAADRRAVQLEPLLEDPARR